MALNFLITKLSLLPHLFRPTYDAIFSTLPFHYRWRLLLQPLAFLSALISSPHWLLNNRTSVLYIPTRSGPKRCLVWHPHYPGSGKLGKEKRLVPLHVDMHGGAWVAGFPEQNARWCQYLCEKTGAVVVSCSYRFAPRHPFPAAHDDVDDIVSWLVSHAGDLGADASLLTLGGSSAGGNLALSAAQSLQQQNGVLGPTRVKGYVGFYVPVNLRMGPEEKPRPPNYPARDPLAFMLPLYDAYARNNRQSNWDDPRLNTLTAEVNKLPKKMLFVVAGIDILAHEQLSFTRRLKEDAERQEVDDRYHVEVKVWDKGFHGWLELPSSVLERERMEAFNMSVGFIRCLHAEHGFVARTEL